MTPCTVDFSVRSVQIPNRSIATDVTVEDIMALEYMDGRRARDGTNALIKNGCSYQGCYGLPTLGIDV